MEIQYKSASNSVKDVDLTKRIVTGYFSIFGNIDSDEDIIRNGAFTKTITESGPGGKNRIWHLYNHWLSDALAKPSILKEDEKGLYFETYMPDTRLANDVLKLYEAGHLTEHSIGFNVINATEDQINGRTVRTITEIKLWEGSSVLWGANEMAQFTGLKELQRRQQSAENILRNGTLTDEGFKSLMAELETIKALLNKQPQSNQNEPVVTEASTQDVINIFNETFKN